MMHEFNLNNISRNSSYLTENLQHHVYTGEMDNMRTA
jgi:hypothetical protein